MLFGGILLEASVDSQGTRIPPAVLMDLNANPAEFSSSLNFHSMNSRTKEDTFNINLRFWRILPVKIWKKVLRKTLAFAL